MTDWRTRLREADPLRDGEHGPEDVERLRRGAMAAAGASASRHRRVLTGPLAIAAALVVVVGGTEIARQRVEMGRASVETTAPGVSPAGAEASVVPTQQQLQFKTPGGTRIIWVFDSEFDVTRRPR